MAEYSNVYTAASQLSSFDQVRLIEDLWVSKASDLSKEWQAEITRRSAQLDAGEVETVAWETVRDEALRRAGIRRES